MLNEKTESSIRNLIQANPTPFYVYDLSKIRERLHLLRSRLSSEFEILYSAKANSHHKILEVMKAAQLSVDVASLGELERALAVGFSVDKISFTGPGKRTEDIARAVELGVGAIVFESQFELSEIDEQAIRLGRRARVVARLAPNQRVGHTGRLIIDEPTQFGFEEYSLDDLVESLRQTKNVDLVGTHSHVQSQILKPEYVLRNFEFALETSILFQTKLRTALYSKIADEQFFISLGGGIGIPYSAKTSEFDLDKFAVGLKSLTFRYSGLGPLGLPMKFAMELGRFLVGESGYFVSKILREKVGHSKGRNHIFAIADGGYSHCQIACGVGQAVRANLPFVLLKKKEGRRTVGSELVSVVGPTCYTQDILIRETFVDGIEVGDHLVIGNVGAYGKQFSPKEFLLMHEAVEHCLGDE